MPHDAEEGYAEHFLVAAARDYLEAYGAAKLKRALEIALSQTPLEVVAK